MYLRALTHGVSKIFLLPRLSIPIMLTLSLTLGAVLTVAAMVSNLMLKPLPDIKAEQELYSLKFNLYVSDKVMIPALDAKAVAELAEYYEQLGELSSISISKGEVSIAEQTFAVSELNASINYLTNVLRQPIILGELPEQGNLLNRVWISEQFWLIAFDKAQNIVGQTIQLRGEKYVIQGVVSDHYSFKKSGSYSPQQIWHFYSYEDVKSKVKKRGSSTSETLLFRSKDRVLTEQDIFDFLSQYYESNPEQSFMMNALKSFNPEFSFQPYREYVMAGEEIVLWSLLATVSVLLIMACLNLINLYLAHYQQRRAEWATHLSVGGTLKTVRRMIFVENFPAVLFATIFGMLAAAWLIRYLPFLFAGNINLVALVELDFYTLVYACALSLVINLAFTVVATKPFTVERLLSSLQSSNKGITDKSASKISNLLFVAQISFAVLILTACAMLARVGYKELNRDFGYQLGNTLMAQVIFNETPDITDGSFVIEEEDKLAKLQQQREQRKSLKRAVTGYSNEITVLDSATDPFGGSFSRINLVTLEDKTTLTYGVLTVAPDFIEAFEIELLEGRNITNEEYQQNLPVAIVNEALAEAIKKDKKLDSVIGYFFDDKEVVGVIVNTFSFLGGGEVMPHLYSSEVSLFSSFLLLMQAPSGYEFDRNKIQNLLLNTSDQIKEVKLKTAAERRDEDFYDKKIQYRFIIMISALTLLLAVLGSIGMARNYAEMKRFELAVRMSTGASRSALLRTALISFRGLFVAAVAIAIGLTASSYLILREQLKDIPELSWFVTTMFLSLLLISVFISIVLVVWKIINQDPMKVLREE